MNQGSHSCQGFTVNSDYSFLFTRPGVSRDQLSVVPMLGEPPSAGQPQILDWQTELGVVARLYGGGRIFTFWADAVGWFRIAPFDGTIEVPDRGTDALIAACTALSLMLVPYLHPYDLMLTLPAFVLSLTLAEHLDDLLAAAAVNEIA